jgi:hypothetical protein
MCTGFNWYLQPPAESTRSIGAPDAPMVAESRMFTRPATSSSPSTILELLRRQRLPETSTLVLSSTELLNVMSQPVGSPVPYEKT